MRFAWRRCRGLVVAAVLLGSAPSLLLAAAAGGASAGELEARPGGSAHASVIGGRVAAPGSLPWLAHVSYYHLGVSRSCTGTVVGPSLVLTAGHCARGRARLADPAGFMVTTGVVDRTFPKRQVSRVSDVLVYPGYRREGRFRGWGDAALLELSTPTAAPPLELAARPFWRPDTRAVVAGWGAAHGRVVPFLRWATTYVQGNRWCRRHAAGRFHARGQICTIKPPRNDTGTCLGDSGGPLLARLPGTEELRQIGIVTSGHVSCSTAWPTVFTRADLVAWWVLRESRSR